MPETSSDTSGVGPPTFPNITAVSVSRLCAASLLAIGLVWSAGAVGGGIVFITGIVWRYTPSYFAFGIGQFGFVAVGAALINPAGVTAQFGLWMILLIDTAAAEYDAGTWLWAVVAAVAGTMLFVGGTWVAQRLVDPLWQVVTVLSLLSAIGIYLLHRYQMVRMDLTGESA